MLHKIIDASQMFGLVTSMASEDPERRMPVPENCMPGLERHLPEHHVSDEWDDLLFRAFTAEVGENPDRAAVLLESLGEVGETNSQTMLCLMPAHLLEQRSGRVYLDGDLREQDFYACMRQVLEQNPWLSEMQQGCGNKSKTRRNPEVPEELAGLSFPGGLAGFLGYDLGRKAMDVPSRHSDGPALEGFMMDPDCLMVADRCEKQIHLIAFGRLESAETELGEMELLLERAAADACSAGSSADSSKDPSHASELDSHLTGSHADDQSGASWSSAFTEPGYCSAIENVIDHIVDGDIYVMNMTQTLEVKNPPDPWTLASRLRRNNPAPFGACINTGDVQVVCASPERFMYLKDSVVQTKPIKGTRKRSSDPAEDEALRNELANDPKERSELLMIVDLERNDLNRVCVPGSVVVTKSYDVEEHPTVFQLVTTIEGKLPEDRDAVDLLEATFPGGSITGAPKRRAMEIIDEQESCSRGLYTGSVGYFGFNGGCDLNIIIRTAVYEDGAYDSGADAGSQAARCTIGAGGGITFESEPRFEYDETLLKAKALLEAMGAY